MELTESTHVHTIGEGDGWFFAFFAQFSIGFIRIRLLFSWFHTTLHWGHNTICAYIWIRYLCIQSELTEYILSIAIHLYMIYIKESVCVWYISNAIYIFSLVWPRNQRGRKRKKHIVHVIWIKCATVIENSICSNDHGFSKITADAYMFALLQIDVSSKNQKHWIMDEQKRKLQC